MMTPEDRREAERFIAELEELAVWCDANAALLPTSAAAMKFYNMAAEKRMLARVLRAGIDETPTKKSEVQ